MFIAILLKKSKQHRQKQHFVVVVRSFRLLGIASESKTMTIKCSKS
jgi:hypothetical protein